MYRPFGLQSRKVYTFFNKSATTADYAPSLRSPWRAANEFAMHDAPVLITGETGTGKELIAQALHYSSERKDKPLVTINCAAISDELIESELFGHKKGAFTGAHVEYKGLFREAEGGTIFLDEIGEISPRLQAALLRALEMDEVRPVGSAQHFKINCRIIAATNADLKSLAEKKQFRADLMYRLQRLEIHLSPLRNRSIDILPLAQHFMDLDRDPEQHATLLPALQARFETYSWPGNVRELRNVVERLRILNSDKLSYDEYDWEDIVENENSQPENILSAISAAEAAINEIQNETSASLIEAEKAKGIDTFIPSNHSPHRRLDHLQECFQEIKK